ncbi:MAG: hypothetical protein KatS3mg129_2641 [Leptospiraceae bacterium]|nr:MAG: hypothetical protein KatS3mg129_2641 [Leptospiraceae bacterium]
MSIRSNFKPSFSTQEISDIFKEIINNFIVFIIDDKYNFLFANKKFKLLLNISEQELINLTLLDLLQEQENIKSQIQELNTSNIINLEISYSNKSFLLPGLFYKNKHILFIGIPVLKQKTEGRENIFRSELFEILKISLEVGDLKTFLENTLKKIVQIPWLSLEAKAGFMLNNDGELRLIAHYNVSDSLVKMCNKVPFGRCLCGKAAETREIIYKSHVDEDHENRPEGIQPHGHYNVPILNGDQLLGVLFLYLKEGHKKQELEIQFLKKLSSILAMVILRFQFENEYQHSLVKLIRTNEIMIQNLKKINLLEELINTYVPDTIKKVIIDKNKNHKKLYFDLESNYFLLLNINGLIRFSEIFPLQKVYETIQEFYSPIIDCILKYNGEVEQYLEDRILAIFNDSSDAIKCSLEIKQILFDINNKRKQFFLKPFHFQLALNYGKTFFGIIGSENRKNWMRYGETIRWLTAMQKKCKKDHIIVSESIYQKEKNFYKFSKPFKITRKQEKEQFIIVRYLLS